MGGAFGAGEHPPALEVDVCNKDYKGEDGVAEKDGMQDGEERAVGTEDDAKAMSTKAAVPPKGGLDEYEWMWKVRDTDSNCLCGRLFI